MSDSMLKLPYPLQDLLNEGYILWFSKGQSKDSKYPKTGQQFWLEVEELHTHNVDPFHKKELKKGERAWGMLKYELERYSQVSFCFRLTGERGLNTFNEYSRHQTLQMAVKHALKYTICPEPPANFLPHDFIEEIIPDTIITFHKRKQPNLNAFRAGDAKTVVFKWLHKRYPNAVIVPEFGIGGVWGKTSIVDMAAFDTKKMIFVEIKAETDSFARVQKQLEVSSSNADEVWLALFEDKHIPKDIPLHVGIISFDRTGKMRLIQKPKILKQNKTILGHIWTKEFHDFFGCYKGVSSWIKNMRGGIEELTKVAEDILGKNARQFTINAWRRRHFLEYVWRRDGVLKGEENAASIARGSNFTDYSKHFYKNYNLDTDRIKHPSLSELAVKEFILPKTKKREAIPFKERMAMARERVKINQIIKEEQ